MLPTATDSLTSNKNFKTLMPVTKAGGGKGGKKTKPKVRKTLIRSEDGNGLAAQSHTNRAMDIWNELQFHLKFGNHDNAIAVLFRVLLEFAVENYIDRNKLMNVHPGDNLAKKFLKVLAHMLAANEIDKKYYEALKKFPNTEQLLSANTLNKYVHHKSFFPSDIHLKSMWDTLSIYVVICLKA